MPSKHTQTIQPRSGQHETSYSRRIKGIVAERDRQMIEIARLRDEGQATSSGVGKAYALLTRFWSKADWSGREEIIRTSAWLLKVEQMASGLTGQDHKAAQARR